MSSSPVHHEEERNSRSVSRSRERSRSRDVEDNRRGRNHDDYQDHHDDKDDHGGDNFSMYITNLSFEVKKSFPYSLFTNYVLLYVIFS